MRGNPLQIRSLLACGGKLQISSLRSLERGEKLPKMMLVHHMGAWDVSEHRMFLNAGLLRPKFTKHSLFIINPENN